MDFSNLRVQRQVIARLKEDLLYKNCESVFCICVQFWNFLKKKLENIFLSKFRHSTSVNLVPIFFQKEKRKMCFTLVIESSFSFQMRSHLTIYVNY